MGTMKFNHPHSLPKESAKKRLETLFSYWGKHGVNVGWTGDSCKLSGKVKGVTFDATLTVKDGSVDGEGPDPGLVMRTAATAYIKKKMGEYLDPKKSDAEILKIDV